MCCFGFTSDITNFIKRNTCYIYREKIHNELVVRFMDVHKLTWFYFFVNNYETDSLLLHYFIIIDLSPTFIIYFDFSIFLLGYQISDLANKYVISRYKLKIKNVLSKWHNLFLLCWIIPNREKFIASSKMYEGSKILLNDKYY